VSAIAIRRLLESAAEDFRTIRLEALRAAPDAFGSTYESEVARPIKAFEERLANSLVFGAYDGEGIIGMAGLARNTGAKEQHKAFLWGMYVRADERRRGAGAALVDAIINEAPDGVEQITLTVVTDNGAALALYARLGFAIYGVEPKALKVGDGYSDETLMMRFLRPE
jgi:ribosomal protein S18 acetylase RimI-like enzyme